MNNAICGHCGRPMSEHQDMGLVGAAKQTFDPGLPWGDKPDQGPITQATQWDDANPHGGAWIDGPVSRVLKFFLPNGVEHGDGWKFLEGWTQQERVVLVKQWIKATWPTPWSMMQTVPEGEEDIGFLFTAWAFGWNLTFGGKKIQACWHKWVDGGPGTTGKYVPSGYRWNPFTRSCEKVPPVRMHK